MTAAKVDHPPHYSVASPIAVPALLALGVCGLELSLECIETLERLQRHAADESLHVQRLQIFVEMRSQRQLTGRLEKGCLVFGEGPRLRG